MCLPFALHPMRHALPFLSARPVNLRIWCPQKTHDVEDLQSGQLPQAGIKRHLQNRKAQFTPSLYFELHRGTSNIHPKQPSMFSCQLVPWISMNKFMDWCRRLLNLLVLWRYLRCKRLQLVQGSSVRYHQDDQNSNASHHCLSSV